ncbi:MAG: hypothetical protein BMS9Abin29_0668 [Gemmatimonadota bacterium]|nr:MAG: hypothetical protein BMS9Abin29_0668 [Gemmatimonadota bacterium]
MTKIIRTFLLAAALVTISWLELSAQGTDLASQTLGRAYWHVFAAYAIGWIVILGWVISIARRLARVEQAVKGS